jgi:GntR family transcriptional regulator, arabinose operon transcriptional repressor
MPTLLYEKVVADLTQKMSERLIIPGQRIPPEKELCREYQVSSITVKRAMKELSKKGLVVRRPKLGTFAAEGAHFSAGGRGRASQKLSTLVFIGSFLNDELISATIHGLSVAGAEYGAHLIVKSSLNDPVKEKELLHQLPDMNIDGAVIVPVHGAANTEQYFSLKLQHRFPFVLIDRYFEGLEVPHVTTDDVDVGYQLTRHLYDQGHRRIAFIGEDLSTTSCRQRYEGYTHALHDHHIAFDPGLVSLVLPYLIPEGENRNLEPELQGYRRLLAQPNHPTAVVAMNNYFAYNLIQVADELGLKIPEDLSVIGVGGSQTAHRCKPVLTYLRQDFEKIGMEAYESLKTYVENNGIRNSVVSATLVPGHSVRRGAK